MDIRNHRKVNIIIAAAVLLVLFALFLLNRSGRFNKEPVVETLAENCYSETLTVITDEDYRPYSFYDKNGDYSGHDVELINMIANELHMNVNLTFMEWNAGIAAINAGEADVFMTCDYSDSFSGVDKLLKSEPVSADEFLVYSREKISTANVLYGKRSAIMKNGNVMAEIDKMQLEKYCVAYPNNRSAMQALIDGETDFAIMRQSVGTVLLQELNVSGIEGYVSLGQSKMCFGINSSRPELVGQINAVLEKYKMNGCLDTLRDKWLTTFIRPYTIGEILSHNIWIVCVFVSLLITIFVISFWNVVQKKRTEEESLRNARVVELLTQDFICVNYVELTDDPLDDPVINYRVSEKLKELIPGWESEKSFSNKLDLLCDNLVYAPDRAQFKEDTMRSKVIREVEKSDAYFINTRLIFNGTVSYYQMKFSPVYESGKLIGFVAGLHSVDDQTKKEMMLQEQLQKALQNEEIASRSKTDFLFNMSHDIRTPLNAIAGFTSMAIKHIDNREKALDCLAKTQQSGNLLLSLINSVLDVSRIESGNAVLNLQEGDIYECFSNIESTMQELAASKDIKLTFSFNDIRDRFILCDFNRCNRIFVNIISNAVKYTNEGGYVNVCCSQIDSTRKGFGLYRYTFEDNGIGMSDEFQKHVFERFSRENNVALSNIQGTGLGMAVCKSFAELMDGTVECSSRLGEGTVFTVTLPFAIQENPSSDAVHPHDDILPEDGLKFSGKRVLVVDDSALNLEIAMDYLSERDLLVETASDGLEAIRLVQNKGPEYYDFILMDIRMPGMGGYDATRAIRTLFPESRLPIIALSANAFEEDKTASLEAGMDGHVAKPIDINELFQIMSQLK